MFYDKLRHKYALIVKKDEAVTDDTAVDDGRPSEKIYDADTNLPIRLLFILNATPLLYAKNAQLDELEYASGTAESLA